MPRKSKEIPLEDIKYHLKGLKTLIQEGKTQEEMAEYYRQNGIDVDQTTISRKIKQMNEGSS
jgi:arginine repressor